MATQSPINWRDHLINFIVVIIGITIAFQLNEWAQSSKDRMLEKKYLESMISDLDYDLQQLDTLIQINQLTAAYIERVIEIIRDKEADKDSLGYFLNAQRYVIDFSPQNSTFRSLTQSGDIRLIEDFELRRKLVYSYDQFYPGIAKFDEINTDYVDSFIVPYLTRRVRFTGAISLDADFLGDYEFINMMYTHHTLINAKVNFYKQAITELKLLRKTIEEYL